MTLSQQTESRTRSGMGQGLNSCFFSPSPASDSSTNPSPERVPGTQLGVGVRLQVNEVSWSPSDQLCSSEDFLPASEPLGGGGVCSHRGGTPSAQNAHSGPSQPLQRSPLQSFRLSPSARVQTEDPGWPQATAAAPAAQPQKGALPGELRLSTNSLRLVTLSIITKLAPPQRIP